MKRITTTDFRDYRRDRFIDAQTTPAARLAPTYMLTNEMGVDGDICEELTPALCAKVEFDIPSAKTKGAELLFYVNADKSTADKPMRLQVNGHVLTHRQNRERMLTGGWDRKKIAAKYLKEGTNEFVFSHSGVLHIDPFPGGLADTPSSRSSRSFDGGKTWHQGTLGEARAIEGEYLGAAARQGTSAPRDALLAGHRPRRRRRPRLHRSADGHSPPEPESADAPTAGDPNTLRAAHGFDAFL